MNIQQEIQRRNALFHNKTISEKRILVAQDIISLLEAGRITAGSTYITLPSATKVKLKCGDYAGAREAILDSQDSCECCAKGAIMLSLTLYNNQEKDFTGWNYLHRKDLEFARKYNIFKNGLLDIFTQSQLHLIEIWFEGWDRYMGIGQYQHWIKGYTELSKKDRLIKIMQNLIDNGGDFIP